MSQDSDLEKTEQPSLRRLDQAREEGQAPQSVDLATFLLIASGIGVLATMGPWMVGRIEGMMRSAFTFDAGALRPDAPMMALNVAAEDGLLTALPILLAATFGAIVARLALGHWTFSSKGFFPDFSRLSPLAWVKRVFSVHGVVELVKSILKAALVGGIGYWVIARYAPEFFALSGMPVAVGFASSTSMVVSASLWLLFALFLVALMDVPYQLWRFYSGLRMTKEELRQESKETEGDPHVKARIRSIQREMARRRMMEAVPKADVVITNPTHYAVAVRYDDRQMAAPVVVAKGMNLVAAQIRELAAEHQVPVLEAPPLARALYTHTDLGQSIPAPLYRAVAEVLAYVYQLRLASQIGGTPPLHPSDLDVPPDLDPGESP